MPLVINTAPTSEPVDLQQTKDHLRVTDETDDIEISSLIKASRQEAEVFLRRALITQTWDYYLDKFYAEIELPKAPLQSVSQIDYTDINGVTQTLNASLYTVDASSDPGYVRLAFDQSYPATRSVSNAVKITFVCGYGESDNVPEPIRQAVLERVRVLYDGAEDSGLFHALLNSYRVPYV